MEDLPLELKERILLFLSPRDLLALTSTSTHFYSLASTSAFWKGKCREERLILQEEGKGLAEQLKIYQRSLLAKRKSLSFLDLSSLKIESYRFCLAKVSNPLPFINLGFLVEKSSSLTLYLSKDIVKFQLFFVSRGTSLKFGETYRKEEEIETFLLSYFYYEV